MEEAIKSAQIFDDNLKKKGTYEPSWGSKTTTSNFKGSKKTPLAPSSELVKKPKQWQGPLITKDFGKAKKDKLC